MLSLSTRQPSPLVAAFVAGLFGAALASCQASAQKPQAGRIVGGIDGIRFEGDQFHIFGWACQQGRDDSIAVHIFANDSLVLGAKADLDSEPAVNRICQDSQGGRHRFWIALPNQDLTAHQGEKLTVRGIRVVGKVENSALSAGEVNDRYRNANPLQGIGYAMGTLEWLFDAAEILRIAGFDPYGYRGAHGQSIEMAVAYYVCFAKNVGFYNTVTAQRAQFVPTINNMSARSSTPWMPGS